MGSKRTANKGAVSLVEQFRTIEPRILSMGSHPGILQAILDFDWLAGKARPTLAAIISAGRNYERLFWGTDEILVRVYPDIASLPAKLCEEINYVVNVSSGRRSLTSTQEALAQFPNLLAVNLFAEGMPESHALAVYEQLAGGGRREGEAPVIIGPSSIGLLLPGMLKLGAIGGVQANQLVEGQLFSRGRVAVFSASGGMTNEIINILNNAGQPLSFALSVGGDRFPALPPREAFLLAEADPDTDTVVYYGELGGEDEYELVDLINSRKFTKRVIAYIAGIVSDVFETPPQFGHAKALASTRAEGAAAKRVALAEVGVTVANSFADFIEAIKDLPAVKAEETQSYATLSAKLAQLQTRRRKYFTSSISGETAGEVEVLGDNLLEVAQSQSLAQLALNMLLGKKVDSPKLVEFTDLVFKLLVDNGPYQSGVINTMITARAGKDLMSSLAAGLLTIGPRFGGASNEAAQNWLRAVTSGVSPKTFVEDFAARREYVQGIGHRKYTLDNPDPRVALLQGFTEGLEANYLGFARAVEQVTTSKKANLILNVDGTLGAVLLDLLAETAGYSPTQLQELVKSGFFDAFFVIPRTIGLTAHYLDQRRLDEGLFRLSPAEVGLAKIVD